MKKNVGYVKFSLAFVMTTVAFAWSLGGAAAAQSVAQSYTADTPLQPGMIVQPASDKSNVKPVTAAEASKMLGVVVQPNDAPLSLSQGEAGQKVYVATTGTYRVLVSNENGAVAKGDYLVVSAIEGIGMKANDISQYVIGKALDGFDGQTNVLSQTTVKDTRGAERTVKFGFVSTDINISRNPLLRSSSAASLPGFLQKASESIANKPVTPVRVYVSLAVVLITAVIVCTVMYAGIRTSLTSMGRNPLARASIMRNLLQVVLIGVIILVAGLFAVYLLLKL